MNDTLGRLGRGYTLNTLFLFTTTAAVILAMISPLLRGMMDDDFGASELVGTAVAGACGMLAVGAVVGLFHRQSFRGACWGSLVGFVLGLAFGPMVLIPIDDFPLVMLAALGGAVLVLGIATAIRLTTRYTSWSDRTSEVVTATAVKPKRHPLDPDPEDDL